MYQRIFYGAVLSIFKGKPLKIAGPYSREHQVREVHYAIWTKTVHKWTRSDFTFYSLCRRENCSKKQILFQININHLKKDYFDIGHRLPVCLRTVCRGSRKEPIWNCFHNLFFAIIVPVQIENALEVFLGSDPVRSVLFFAKITKESASGNMANFP